MRSGWRAGGRWWRPLLPFGTRAIYAKYARYFGDDLSPTIALPGAVIASALSSHGCAWGSLTLNPRDTTVKGHLPKKEMERVKRLFAAAPRDDARVLVSGEDQAFTLAINSSVDAFARQLRDEVPDDVDPRGHRGLRVDRRQPLVEFRLPLRGDLRLELAIVTVGADGSVSPLTTIPLEGTHGLPCAIWAPDGRWAAFGGAVDNAEPRGTDSVWLVDTVSGEVRQLPGYHPNDLEWRPGTDELATTGDRPGNEHRDASIDIYTVSTGDIRTVGDAQALRDYSIALPDGLAVRLSTLATVTDAAADPTEAALLDGKGVVSLDSSGVGEYPVTWAARAEAPASGRTSPEELIAAAHSSCFSMALSHALAGAGTPPARLETKADVTFQPGEGITGIHLTVRASVPGLSAADFEKAAQTAKENCPVSKALAGTKITLDAALA